MKYMGSKAKVARYIVPIIQKQIDVYKRQSDMYKITVTTNPKVVNRRKYPRMPISNKCTICLLYTSHRVLYPFFQKGV